MIKELAEKRGDLLGNRPGLSKESAGEKGLEKIHKALEGDDEYLRRLAEAAMGTVREERGIERPKNVEIQTSFVKKLAEVAFTVSERKEIKSTEHLLNELKGGDPSKRLRAVSDLGNTGTSGAVKLISALQEDDWFVRGGATVALGLMGGPAVEPLLEALESRVWDVRRRAARILGWIGDSRAVEPLIKALSDENDFVRMEAVDALSIIGGSKAGKALRTYIRKTGL